MNNGFGYHAAFPTAVKPNAQIRLDIQKIKEIKKEEDLDYLGYGTVGHSLSVEVIKNEPFRPHGRAVLDLIYANGFDPIDDVINMAVNLDFITRLPRNAFMLKDVSDPMDSQQTRQYVIDNFDPLRAAIAEEYTKRDKWYPQSKNGKDHAQDIS